MSDKDKNDGVVKVPTSKALNLGELIAYQDGSVVSREVLKSPAGTITVFAFDAGQGLSEHSAPFDAVVTVLDGVCEFTIGGEPVVGQAGQTVIMPANVPHALHAAQKFKMLLVMIKG